MEKGVASRKENEQRTIEAHLPSEGKPDRLKQTSKNVLRFTFFGCSQAAVPS